VVVFVAVVAVDPEVSEPEVAFAADLEVSEPGVAFAADFVELRAAVDIALAFVVLILVFVAAVEVYSFVRPRSLSSPSIDFSANSSSSVEAVRWESVHSSTGVRTNYGLCNILSNPGLRQNKNLEHFYNKPNPGYNNVSDTSDLPIDATTSRYRNRDLLERPEQHKHMFQE